MPANQRPRVLDICACYELAPEKQLAFATLVRDQLPPDEQVQSLARLANNYAATDDYTAVTAFLERIKVTPSERGELVKEAAGDKINSLYHKGKITTAALDAIRGWTDVQAPGSTDQITGKALSGLFEQDGAVDFGKICEFALHYHEFTGNDDVLVSFLDGHAAFRNKEQARALAEKITDWKRRVEILEKLE